MNKSNQTDVVIGDLRFFFGCFLGIIYLRGCFTQSVDYPVTDYRPCSPFVTKYDSSHLFRSVLPSSCRMNLDSLLGRSTIVSCTVFEPPITFGPYLAGFIKIGKKKYGRILGFIIV